MPFLRACVIEPGSEPETPHSSSGPFLDACPLTVPTLRSLDSFCVDPDLSDEAKHDEKMILVNLQLGGSPVSGLS